MIPPITPVPTWEDVEKARLAKLDAWLEWVVSDNSDDLWAAYHCAIERHNYLQFLRTQALEQEAIRCLT